MSLPRLLRDLPPEYGESIKKHLWGSKVTHVVGYEHDAKRLMREYVFMYSACDETIAYVTYGMSQVPMYDVSWTA